MNSVMRRTFCWNDSPLRARIRPRMACSNPALRSSARGSGRPCKVATAEVRAPTSISVRLRADLPDVRLSSLRPEPPGFDDPDSGVDQDLGNVGPGASDRPTVTIRRLSAWCGL